MANWRFSLNLLGAITIATILPMSTAQSSPPIVFPPTIPSPPSSFPPTILPPPPSPSITPTTQTPPPPPRVHHHDHPHLHPPSHHQGRPHTSRPTTAPPPPPTGWAELQEQQLKNIINVLIGAGDFSGWAGLLSAANLSTLLPFTTAAAATLFIPGDDALSHLPTATIVSSFDPFIIPYHIVPQQRLRFSDLQLLSTHSRLPTLLPSNTILITNNSRSNFTLDGSRITHPDLYVNSDISVHGIKTILDYSNYGGGGGGFFPIPPPAPPIPETVAPPVFPNGEVICGGRRSDVACLCTEFPIIFLVVCATFAFKNINHGIPLIR